ncbi:MAG TPA: hypothetical protein VI749_08795 [Candidatus Omnitrophota bacterium]|nr:hypothetical protein [Candidatus Omnitrophota bacterium]
MADQPFVTTPLKQSAQPLAPLHKIKIGMSESEAKGILGATLVIGYRLNDASPQQLKPITIAQPYREAELVSEGKRYKVSYYYTGVAKADDLVSEDELTPLIFESGHLVGKGLDDLDRIQRN